MNTPTFKTWDAAADYVLTKIITLQPSRWPDTPSFEQLYADHRWWRLALSSIQRLQSSGAWDDHAALRLLVSKQRDYGVRNILKFGLEGISVRLWDKIARLENLDGNDAAPQNESVVDTLTDIVGYVVIATMLTNGWFELPLKTFVGETRSVDPWGGPKDSVNEKIAKMAGRRL